MKTKEDLNALRVEVETASRKLHELTEEELEQVNGGAQNSWTKVSDDGKGNTVWVPTENLPIKHPSSFDPADCV